MATAVLTTPAVNTKLAERFRTWADALQPKIDHAGRPMTQNPTPKRNREYQSRMHDCRNFERTQRALLSLADAHDNGTVPELLAYVKTKDEVSHLVHKGLDGSRGGYYSVIEADDYSVTTPVARLLQEMISGNSAQRRERERQRKVESLEAEIKLTSFPGFFPTPAGIVELMLSKARIKQFDKILEPSAGSGNIADAVKKYHPNATLSVIERVYKLRELLELKGHDLIAEDFLEVRPSQRFDRIVMNPPFERLQDIDHVTHAFNFLVPGGRLVAIMAPGFEFRNDRKSEEFRNLLNETDAEVDALPEGSFKSSGTGVATRIVTIDKP